MTGALWAALSGVGFGVFQVVNARAVRAGGSVYLATFVQVLVATAVFGVIVGAEGRAGQLADVPVGALVLFALAGMFHFFLGWTTMSQSQARIGAARTAPLIATSPNSGEELRGLSILNVEPERARDLKEQDPAVRAGLYSVLVIPWMVPAGAMAFSPSRFPRSVAEASGD